MKNYSTIFPIGETENDCHVGSRPRVRVKAGSQPALPIRLAEEILTAISAYNKEGAREEGFEPFTIEDYIYYIASGEVDTYGVETIGDAVHRYVFQMLVGTLDPWPGISQERLRHLIGKARFNECNRLGLSFVKEGWSGEKEGVSAPPLTTQQKVCAARNRMWILDDVAREKAEHKAAAAAKRRAAKTAGKRSRQ